MDTNNNYWSLFILLLLLWNSSSPAGEADIVDVKTSKNSDNSYSFTVTVLHKDTGWNHYANKWDIIDQQGTVLATRILHHPHVEEQPFSRSLSGVTIPANIKTVTVRGHDSVHEYGGKVVNIELP